MKQVAFKGRLLLRRILTGLSLGAVAITFQACYGSPEVALNGTVRSADDEKPIPGISVSAYDENDYVLTGSRGQYHMLVMDWEQTIYFKDIDGEKNGWFEDKEVKWKPKDGALDVVLERKQINAE